MDHSRSGCREASCGVVGVYTDIVEFDSLVVFFWWKVEEESGARFQVDQCVMWSNLWESTLVW
jgi:hypothetical protein